MIRFNSNRTRKRDSFSLKANSFFSSDICERSVDKTHHFWCTKLKQDALKTLMLTWNNYFHLRRTWEKFEEEYMFLEQIVIISVLDEKKTGKQDSIGKLYSNVDSLSEQVGDLSETSATTT